MALAMTLLLAFKTQVVVFEGGGGRTAHGSAAQTLPQILPPGKSVSQ